LPRACLYQAVGVVFETLEGENLAISCQECQHLIQITRTTNRPFHVRWFRTDFRRIINLEICFLIDPDQLKIQFLLMTK
jgi:hypothetical protein